MRDTIWERQIPTLLGIGLVAFSIFLTSIIIKNPTIIVSNATPSEDPEDITITNISDTSFSVSYTTKDNVVGSINWGENSSIQNRVELEDFDREKGVMNERKIHSITITGLKPATKYYFTIISGSTIFLKENLPFEITTTSPILSLSTSQTSLNGKVILPDGNPPNEAIAYLEIQGVKILSTLTQTDGTYTFPLDSLEGNNLSSLAKLTFINDSLKSNVFLFIKQNNFLPTITLSYDYDFTLDSNPVATNSGQPTSRFPFPSPQILNR